MEIQKKCSKVKRSSVEPFAGGFHKAREFWTRNPVVWRKAPVSRHTSELRKRKNPPKKLKVITKVIQRLCRVAVSRTVRSWRLFGLLAQWHNLQLWVKKSSRNAQEQTLAVAFKTALHSLRLWISTRRSPKSLNKPYAQLVECWISQLSDFCWNSYHLASMFVNDKGKIGTKKKISGNCYFEHCFFQILFRSDLSQKVILQGKIYLQMLVNKSGGIFWGD